MNLKLEHWEISSLILFAAVAWTKAGIKLSKTAFPDEDESLYDMLKGHSKAIADTIEAIHNRDVKQLEQKKKYVSTAWALVQGSIHRKYWPCNHGSKLHQEWIKESKKLVPLGKVVKRFIK